jgi:phosphoribosylanthranilate isomerase
MKTGNSVAVKICGIRSMETLPVLLQEKPEYVGFVFAPSKRRVTPETAAALGRELPSAIRKVGVFMNEGEDKLKDLASRAHLDILQLHGQEPPSLCDRLRREGYLVWKAFPLSTRENLYRLQEYEVDGYLVDTAGTGGTGGTGTVFPWHWLTSDPGFPAIFQPLILAGGLHPGNIQKALEQVTPAVVDVSSGVETSGIKDPLLIREFIQKVRNYHVD